MESLIRSLEHETLSNGDKVDLITLHGGQIIVLTRGSIAAYKNEASRNDPLGNGLIGLTPIPDPFLLKAGDNGYVHTYRSGYLGLYEGMALIITPFRVSLFQNNDDALTGKNPLAYIDLTPLDLC